jgi:hypothetical protein
MTPGFIFVSKGSPNLTLDSWASGRKALTGGMKGSMEAILGPFSAKTSSERDFSSSRCYQSLYLKTVLA